MSAAPAALAGLSDTRAASPTGSTPTWSSGIRTPSFDVDPRRLQQRHKLTPYAGRTLFAVPCVTTFVRGERGLGSTTALDARRIGGRLSMSAPFLDLRRSRLRAARRRGRRRQRRFFAPKENLIKARSAGLERGRVHRPRQMDGRLGDAPAPRSRPGRARLVHRPARRARASSAASTSTPRSSPATIPESCAIDVCDLPGMPASTRLADGAPWRELLARPPLEGDAHNLIADRRARRRRRTCGCGIYPGRRRRAAARATARSSPTGIGCGGSGEVDLAAAEHGGVVVACSDMFFGSRHNLIMPGRRAQHGRRLGDEAAARARARLDDRPARRAASIRRVEIDTRHFKGNAPGACSLDVRSASRDGQPLEWRGMARTAAAHAAAAAHASCRSRSSCASSASVTHVRFNIFPDGGVARLRLFGRPRR